MNPHDITRVSKELSWLLRHGAGEQGLAMDAAGWVSIDEVLRKLRIPRATLDEVVAKNNKSRLQVEGGRIRACQGHSRAGMPVTLDALEASWVLDTRDDAIWHGTNLDALASIAKEGLLPIDRTHVHLAEGLDSSVGKRANVAVMLKVEPPRMRAEGIGLYRSPNGVLLARRVPPSCITDVRCVSARAKREEPQVRALFVTVWLDG
jgi:putative RNA 2'-phosphotransferase